MQQLGYTNRFNNLRPGLGRSDQSFLMSHKMWPKPTKHNELLKTNYQSHKCLKFFGRIDHSWNIARVGRLLVDVDLLRALSEP